MANKMFHDVQSGSRELKFVNAKVTIGSTGACTLVAAASNGVSSITRTSAGLYQLTLSDKYSSLVTASVMQLVASAQDINIQVVAEDVASAKTLSFVCLTGATATDPASGSILYISLGLKNTSVGV